jgi:hypothetical protein
MSPARVGDRRLDAHPDDRPVKPEQPPEIDSDYAAMREMRRIYEGKAPEEPEREK